LKFLIDTANLDDIKKALTLGVISGVTTNPSIIAREGNVKFINRIKEICQLIDGPVHVQVTTSDAKKMVEQARELANISPNIVVKIPAIYSGFQAIKALREENITTNATTIFSANQALLAAIAGASFVSPYLGCIEDLEYETIIEDIVTIFKNYDIVAEIVTASVKKPIHVKKAALAGADIVTLPYNVLKVMIEHPATNIWAETFLDEWKNSDVIKPALFM
jgi:transaldolase